MVRDKRTIGFDVRTTNLLEPLIKKLGFRNLSHMVDYICYRHASDPIEILRAKAREHQQKLMYYTDLLQELEPKERQKDLVEIQIKNESKS
jgi:hypothetical protein